MEGKFPLSLSPLQTNKPSSKFGRGQSPPQPSSNKFNLVVSFCQCPAFSSRNTLGPSVLLKLCHTDFSSNTPDLVQAPQRLPWGPGKPLEGQPKGCPSVPSRVYSCSIPNQGCWLDTMSIILLQVCRRFDSGREKRLMSTSTFTSTPHFHSCYTLSPSSVEESQAQPFVHHPSLSRQGWFLCHAQGTASTRAGLPFPFPGTPPPAGEGRRSMSSPADWRLYLKTSQSTSLLGSLRKGSRNMAAGRRYMSLLEPSDW